MERVKEMPGSKQIKAEIWDIPVSLEGGKKLKIHLPHTQMEGFPDDVSCILFNVPIINVNDFSVFCYRAIRQYS